MPKKVYLYKAAREALGLDPGCTYDKDGNLVPYEPKNEAEVKPDERTI